jgi:hypothetical protein
MNESTVLSIGGKRFDLKPMSPKITKAVMAYQRGQAIEEFFQTAARLKIPGDIVNRQITIINQADAVQVTAELLAFTLHQRSGAALDECLDLPQAELMEHEAAIMDLPEVKEDEPDLEGALRVLGIEDDDEQHEGAIKRLIEVLEEVKEKKMCQPAS